MHLSLLSIASLMPSATSARGGYSEGPALLESSPSVTEAGLDVGLAPAGDDKGGVDGCKLLVCASGGSCGDCCSSSGNEEHWPVTDL